VRVRVGNDNETLWPIFRRATAHPIDPERYEIVDHDDVYPTVWAHWGPTEYTVIGYMRDGRVVKGVSPRKVNESKGL